MPRSYEPGHFNELKTESATFKPDPNIILRTIDDASTYAIRGGIGEDPEGCAKAESRLNLAGSMMSTGLEEGPIRNKIVSKMTASSAGFRHFCPE
ncbi:MAG: hypothetical protein EOM37_07240 [Proteobacteria bacterium]|jgi:hypothetical protein|nr:hypothetical protein [Alphaproteobacteria bacterium]NCC03824.1 hypothetical protein [Pseudomonadota bacterium]